MEPYLDKRNDSEAVLKDVQNQLVQLEGRLELLRNHLKLLGERISSLEYWSTGLTPLPYPAKDDKETP